MNGLALWWRERSLREQRLLLVMLGLLLLVVGWLLIVRPLGDALDSARTRHGAAVIALAEARARAGTATRSAAPRSLSGPVDGLVGRTANEAGFANARITAHGPARALVVIEAARPQALFGWINRLEAQGLAVERLVARTNPDRTVHVEAAFRAGNLG
jgi:general secretion pathway protein M